MIVVHSYHHGNTEKVAQAIAKILGAPVRTPALPCPGELIGCDLVGFGSGIDSGSHYRPLLDFVDGLPRVDVPGHQPRVSRRKAFIFSTCGVPGALVNEETFAKMVSSNHRALRQKLQVRGYEIIDEFGCVGFNTNSFLKLFGGLNKGRPDEDDLQRAAEFARRLMR